MQNAILNIPQLNSHNYERWAKIMQLVLKLEGLWNITRFGDESLPRRSRAERSPAPTPSQCTQNERQDIKAQLVILSHIDDESFKQVMECDTARAIWSELSFSYRPIRGINLFLNNY